MSPFRHLSNEHRITERATTHGPAPDALTGEQFWLARQLRPVPGSQTDPRGISDASAALLRDELHEMRCERVRIVAERDAADALVKRLQEAVKTARQDAFLSGYAAGMDHANEDGDFVTAAQSAWEAD
ncbi:MULTISPECIES: hypothetical protein [Salipiger]|jgi:hypothetical protein|uniref:Uncharacterized protein n=1 Tax=Salipiger profundus TaxID=1229727 RepID=A0A1U7D530_9RHOB|nr:MULTISPECIES: hypothetical protein [Salipiger]APX23175.1 hypothetical protein Ga0080559_TMP2379 [Salipiger profundus]GGA13786.1 hypothetical protein GCM10011326_27390 [Salipiger profundus]SFD16719.1 hypothetical protein SAMN05444415_10826 [Salipiger profundus]